MIPRISAPLASRAFHDAYWRPREPVVVTGAAGGLMTRHDGWSPTTLMKTLRARRDEVVQNLLWYDTSEGVLAERGDLPAFLADHLYGDAHLTRRHHYRLFVHPKGHVTSLHYEGNLLDVWSLQLAGTKRWKLRRGDVAHRLLPFYFVDNQASYAGFTDEPEWTYVVDLAPGELLYLPRGWYHHVECLTDDNVALSVVSAPKDPARLDAVTLDTYREQLALQVHLRALLPRRFGAKVDTFVTNDATGHHWAHHYIAGVPATKILRRLASDLALVTPRMLATLLLDRRTRAYLGYLRTFERRLQRQLDPA
jgi:hypothetical protein